MLRKSLPFWLVIIMVTFPIEAVAKDTSLRCGNSLISIGDSKSRLLYHCGEPHLTEVIGYSKRPESNDKIEFLVESWTYDISRSHFYIITFFGGRVKNIESEKKW